MLYFKDNNFIKMFNLSTERLKKKIDDSKIIYLCDNFDWFDWMITIIKKNLTNDRFRFLILWSQKMNGNDKCTQGVRGYGGWHTTPKKIFENLISKNATKAKMVYPFEILAKKQWPPGFCQKLEATVPGPPPPP
jgi:hypothetical protein